MEGDGNCNRIDDGGSNGNNANANGNGNGNDEGMIASKCAAGGSDAGAPRGIVVGIEIHQQLDTACKLFCGCPTRLREDAPHYSIVRRLKPTASELGDVDRAAVFEAFRRRSFTYQGYRDTVCLVELDEEPPHRMNDDALGVALAVAALANMTPVDEVHVMRKLVIDGSNTTGFQRTAKVAYGGWVMDGGGRISVQSLCLEEDAARKVTEGAGGITYRLDRLGIPLVEITTGPDIRSGEQAARVALSLGRLLKSTGKMKRGLGAIRQDLNISIEGGARVEVKGVQELGLISAVVEIEARRQAGLLEIRSELRRRGAPESRPEIKDLTAAFEGTASKVLRRALDASGRVCGIRLERFAGLLKRELQPGRRFGTELSDRAKASSGVGGIFHSDELPAYGITAEEVSRAMSALECKDGDAMVMVAASPEACVAALNAVADRALEAMRGVPAEVRAAAEDGTTRFMRPMPGSARMYPETDVPSMVVTKERFSDVREALPEALDAKEEHFVREYGLSRDLAALIADSPYTAAFESLVKSDGLSPSFVAGTFEYTFPMLRREGVDVDSFGEAQVRGVLLKVSGGEVAKEAVPDVFRWLASNRGATADDAVRALSLGSVGEGAIRAAVVEAVERNIDLVRRDGERAMSPIMGDLMKLFRGRVDGKLLAGILREEMERRSRQPPR